MEKAEDGVHAVTLLSVRHCERLAKQSICLRKKLDCRVASLPAMTAFMIKLYVPMPARRDLPQ